jgi:hypothetical protein
MSVTQLRHGRRPRLAANLPPSGEARILGAFRSPTGATGTMTGWFRLVRFVADGDRLHAEGVFTGDLCDADGSSIGIGSRRRTVPVELTRSPDGLVALLGPLEVDLLGLLVSVPTFTLDARRSVPVSRSPAGPAGRRTSGDGSPGVVLAPVAGGLRTRGGAR